MVVRIDFVITELFVGGAERCLTELAIGCAEQGDRVRVASIGSLPTGIQARFIDRLNAHGIEVFSANCDQSIQLLTARSRLRAWMKSDRPDVVQTMLYHANLIGTMAARSAGIDVCVGGVRVAERSRIRSRLEAWAMNRMSAVVCVSDSVLRFVHQSRNTRTSLHIIGNSIDLAHVDAVPVVDWSMVSPAMKARGEQVLLFVGRLHPQKGLDVLLQTLPELLKRYPEMRVVIVGDGPLREWLEEAALKFERERVLMVGWRSDALSLMKGCRLLVLPSRYEGMPNVVMEAMAASKPVAATRVEGISELLREGAIDQSCPPEDSNAMFKLLVHLWGDPARSELIGERNREIIAAHHSITAMVQSYRDLYATLRQGLTR